MALVLKDRVKQTAAAPGTGTITLGATAAGFQSFASVGNGNTTYYAIVDPVSGDWEVNYGVYTSSGTTLTRNATPLSSSTGTLVNFTGTVDVFLTYPSEKAVWQDLSGVVAQQSFGAITATSAALTTGTITGAPVNATDIVNKEYADSIASGLNYHQPVNYASTAALPAYTYNNGSSGVGATITANANGALSLGGGSPTATQRVLVKDEVSGNAPYNGVYVVTQAGSAGTPFILTRASDYDTSGTGTNEIDQGDYVLVISGTLASTAWVQQTPLPITVGTTALTFLQFNAPITYTAGTGLNLSPATTFNISNTGVSASTYGSASAVPVFAVNAQGQITSVTNTNIAINGSQVSGNISGQAGSVANALTLGTYLTGGTYNGSAAVTATVDATSANTASKVVARDSSGNFSAGTITATLNGTATSTASATNLSGGAANQIAYQSAANTTAFATAPSASNQVLNWNGSAFTWSAGTISGVPLGSNLNSLTAGTYLTGTAYNGSAAQTWAVDATSANTASKVVARDASGDFSAGTITASLSGNATSATNSTTTSQRAFSGDISTTGQGRFTGWYSGNAATGLGVEAGISSGEGYVIAYDRTTSTYGALNIQTSSASLRLSGSTVNVSTGALQQGGSQVLTAANYNSYAPTLTGTGASGTWNINVTGSAGSAPGYLPLSGGTMTGTIVGGSGMADLFTGNYAGALRGYLYNDTSGFGLLTYNGNWAVRVNYGTNNVYIPGIGYSDASLRAPIFYDTDNTSYYVDPASTSQLSTVYMDGWLYKQNTAGIYFTAYSYGIQAAGVVGSYGNIATYGTGQGGWNGYNLGGQWTLMNSGNGDNIGIHSNSTSWLWYWDGGVTNFYRGYTQFANSARAPIFYDSANTGYYVVPSSTSNISATYIGGHLYTSYNSTNPIIRVSGASSAGLLLQDNSSAYMLQLYGVGNTYGFLSSAWGSWDLRKINGGSLYLNNESTYYYGSSETYMNRVYGVTDIRSPIYYDLNDTAYYVDPNSVSSQSSILVGYNSASPYVYNVASTGYLTFGTTSDPTNYSIKTVLENYNGNHSKLSLYWYTGIRHYASQYYGGHRFYDIDGTQYFGIGVSGNWSYSIYSHRAPIFYDLDNTGYYVDPASTSILNVLNCYGNVTAYYSSDIKFKTNVRNIPNAIETVESIGGKLFDWTDEYLEEHGGEDPYFMRKEDFGVVAQDVLKVFPVAVRTRPDGSLAVDYEKLSALAFAAVAELSTRVKSLEARI